MTIQLLFLIPLFAVAHGDTLTIDAAKPMKLSPKIVNGRLARPGEIPYQVSLQNIKQEHHFCGGVIINELYVLTAAHCLEGADISDISVNVGTINVQKPHSVHLIERVYLHEEYRPSDSWRNDIALIEVKSPFAFTNLVSAVDLPEPNQPVEPGSPAVVSGYGLLSKHGRRTTDLYVVDILIANQTYCKTQYAKSQHVYDTQICAYDPVENKGSCQGDSGGPLTVNGQLVGLVSWAHGCASTRYPTVYTRVSSYINWIYERMIENYN